MWIRLLRIKNKDKKDKKMVTFWIIVVLIALGVFMYYGMKG